MGHEVLQVAVLPALLSHGLLLRAPARIQEWAVNTFAVLRAWQDHMEAQGRLSAKTRRLYTSTVIRWLADTLIPLDEVTEADIHHSVRALAGRPAARDLLLRSLHSLYRYAAKAEGIADPSADFVVRNRRPSGPPEYLTRDELEWLFTAAEEVDPRARPTLELIYGSVARIHEATELRPEDVDLNLRQVRFELGTKNDRPKRAPLGPRAYAAALRLLELQDYRPKNGKRRPGKLIGVGDEQVRQWMKKAGRLAGLTQRMYPHLLRHSALTHLANDPEVSVAVVVAAGNWQSPEPYDHYVAALPESFRSGMSKL